MAQVLWPDQVRLHSNRLWTSKPELDQESRDWYIASRHTYSRDKQCDRHRELYAMHYRLRETSFQELNFYKETDCKALTRRPLQLRSTIADVTRDSTFVSNHTNKIQQTIPKSGSESGDQVTSSSPPPPNCTCPENGQWSGRTIILRSKKKIGIRPARQSINRELNSLLSFDKRHIQSEDVAVTDVEYKGKLRSRTASSTRTANRYIVTEKSEEHLEMISTAVNDNRAVRDESCERKIATDVLVPSWRIVDLKRRYVIECTENLGDEVFQLRHQRFEIHEKRRKRWDQQRQRELLLLDRLHERKDEINTDVSCSPPLDNHQMLSLKVIEAEPVVAFGHFIASIPPCEFTLPRSIRRQSKRPHHHEKKSSKKDSTNK